MSDPRPPALQRIGAGLALIGPGALTVTLGAPLGLVWLQLVMFAPALWLLRRLRGGRALLAGWLMGIAIQGAPLAWIAPTVERFTNIPFLGGVAVLGLAGVVFGSGFAAFGAALRPICDAAGRWWPVAAALWFTAVEFLSPLLFPWTYGSFWVGVPGALHPASLAGPALLTFGAILGNATLVAAFEARRGAAPGAAKTGAACVAALAVLLAGWGAHRERTIAAAEAAAEPVRIALIQSNIEAEEWRALNRAGRSRVADRLVAQSAAALEADPEIDVLVWPEAAIKGHPGRRRHEAVRALAAEHGVEIWLGALFRSDDRGSWRPGAYRVDGTGRVADRYDKNALLPFGEYMPGARLFPILRRIEGVASMEGGGELSVLEGPARFSFLICYEAIRTRLVRDAAAGGPELLVNVTYDGWFGDTLAPHQHLQLAATQAAAVGVPMVRAATTGVSAFIDARGVVRGATEVFQPAAPVAEVRPLRVPGPYARLGDWFARLATLISLALLATRARAVPLAAAAALLMIAPVAWNIDPRLPTSDTALWVGSMALLVAGAARSFHARRVEPSRLQ